MFGFDQVSQPLVLDLQQPFSLVDLFFLDQGGEGSVEVGLGRFIDQVLVAAVFLQEQEHFVVDDHVVEDVDPVLLFLEQFVEVFKGCLLHDPLV